MTWLLIITWTLGGEWYQTTGALDRQICLAVVEEANAGRLPIISDAGDAYAIVAVACHGPDGVEAMAVVGEVGS